MEHDAVRPCDQTQLERTRKSPTVEVIRSFVAIFHKRPEDSQPLIQVLPAEETHFVTVDPAADLGLTGGDILHEALAQDGTRTFLIGDDADWDGSHRSSCMGNAVRIEWNSTTGSLRVLSSIAGLPPIFIYRAEVIIVASELGLVGASMRSPTIDTKAATELFRIGYPLDHRTLLSGVELMPAGHALDLDVRGTFKLTRAWELPDAHPQESWSAHIDRQAEAFRHAVRRLHLTRSVFSLTGGLDTRAIFAALLTEGARVPACTLSGAASLSLDARTARELCQAYGLEHMVVRLDGHFLRDLPTYVVEASRLSGGLASLEQAHEVYFHRQLTNIGARRLSGNLGNQVGRLGLERVSMRNANTAVLHESVRAHAASREEEHRLNSAVARFGQPHYGALIEREYAFASLGNFTIGHHFMIQQSPYASRELIELSAAAPWNIRRVSFLPHAAHLRDLRHRFLGYSRKQSFQRKFIESTGGVAARYPINWGWRAGGGVSLRGLAWGTLALLDAASVGASAPSRFLRYGLRAMKADGVHEVPLTRPLLDTRLREFINDTLRTAQVRESALFNHCAVVNVLDEHYHGARRHHNTLAAMLDLALAEQQLTGRARPTPTATTE